MNALVVEAVLEASSHCSDADRSRAALTEALAAARAPARARHSASSGSPEGTVAGHWTVTMKVVGSAAGARSVEAVIVDDAGTVVAQRTLLDRSAGVCLPLTQAVGAWASLVLDAEMVRAKDDDRAAATATGWTRTPQVAGAPPAADRASDTEYPPLTSAPRPARSVDLGGMLYLRNGLTPSAGIVGISPFVTVEVATGWVLRPALFFGRSTSRIPVRSSTTMTEWASHVGARADFCRRIPGNYVERRGVELDLCVGLEGAAVTGSAPSQTAFADTGHVGAGPSANLRGELGGGVALELRGGLGANFIRTTRTGESSFPVAFAVAELGASMRLP